MLATLTLERLISEPRIGAFPASRRRSRSASPTASRLETCALVVLRTHAGKSLIAAMA